MFNPIFMFMKLCGFEYVVYFKCTCNSTSMVVT